MTTNSLNILLIEDNPGDARFVRELIESSRALERRFESAVRPVSELTNPTEFNSESHLPSEIDLTHVDRLSTGIDELERGRIDVVLLDLILPDTQGLDALDAVLDIAPTVPVVVLTGMQDHGLGLEALDHGAQEYLVKDEINADLLLRSIFHAIQREQYEQALQRQHEHLSTLYEITSIVQDIAGSLIDYSTIEEIESTVCERITASDMYDAAWIGELDQVAGSLKPRVQAAPDDFLDGWMVSFDEEDDPGLITQAARTKETKIVQSAHEVPEYGEWRKHAHRFGYRSVAAIPVVYQNALYSILVVYSDRPKAFEFEEREIMRGLGNLIGHAINSVERLTALMGDDMIELEFLFSDFIDEQSAYDRDSYDRIDFLTTIPAGGDRYIQHANVIGYAGTDIEALFEPFPEFNEVRVIKETPDRTLVEIQYEKPPIDTTLATYGGHILKASLENGDYRVTIGLAPDADVRLFVESVREAYNDVELIAQRSVESTSSMGPLRAVSDESSLTEKQRSALEAAYFSGYFDQPRRVKGGEIADSLGVTASTFHQHLRAGLRKLLAAEFEGQDPAVSTRSKTKQ